MKIGVLSDSHDHLEAISLAVTRFNNESVRYVFHAGDIVSPFTMLYFKPLKAKLHIIWGNNDGDKLLLTKKFAEIKAIIHGNFMNITIGNRRIAMIHGTNEAFVRALARCNEYDLVIRGHTHKPELVREGATLILNPGAVSGYLSYEKTVAIVDLKSIEARIISLY